MYSKEFCKLINKADKNKVETEYIIPENLTAPLLAGQKIGEVVYKLGDKNIGSSEICVMEDVGRVSIFGLYLKLIKAVFTGT